MNRRSLFQRLGALAAVRIVSDRVAAQEPCDQVPTPTPPSFDEMRHARMVIGNDAWKLILSLARSSASVLVSGERGTGRTLAARLFHELSLEPDAPLLTVDCSQPGTIWRACSSETRGTLVLENLTALNMSEQKQVLEWMRQKSRPPCRLICTTAAMPSHLVERGLFSANLYYRINVISLELQPLRERPDVILPLAVYAATRAAAVQNKLMPQITPPAFDVLLRYGWPGNVRELDRVMALAVGRRQNSITASDVIVESRPI
jgi:DNA-binding NtrC family response regulator